MSRTRILFLTSSPLSQVKPPRQPRSRKTLERIVRAGIEILTRDGPAAVTIQDVVTRARSSVGSFYARFGGKEDFLAYLEERIREEEVARWADAVRRRAWHGQKLSGAVADAVGVLAEAARDGFRSGETPGPDLAARRRAREALLETLEAQLLTHRDEIVHEDPELAVRLGLAALTGLLEKGLGRAAGDGAREAVTLREARLLLGMYLRGGEPRPDEDRVDFFEAWG